MAAEEGEVPKEVAEEAQVQEETQETAITAESQGDNVADDPAPPAEGEEAEIANEEAGEEQVNAGGEQTEESGESEAVVQTPQAKKCIFPEEKPDGVLPMMISMTNMEKYELKTGDGIKDTIPYKWFEKAAVMEEIQSIGFYSDFNEFKKDIVGYTGERILVIADYTEVYGENWMICVTEDAANMMHGILEEEELRLQEERRKIEEAEAKIRAAEEAERNVVFEDKPLIPRPITSSTHSETKAEIEWLDVKPARKLMNMVISRKRSEFGAPIKFSDREAEQSGLIEFRQHKDPNFELKRMTLDVGLQACPSWLCTWLPNSPWAEVDEVDENHLEYPFSSVAGTAASTGKKSSSVGIFDYCADSVDLNDDQSVRELPRLVESSSQTSVYRSVNSSTQYEYVELEEEEKQIIEDKKIGLFLSSVMPVLEFALQQNETMDVFANEFTLLRSEEVSGLGNKEDNHLRELRTFTDLVYSNGKVLSCVNWHPLLPNVVACACAEPLKFDQRVEYSGKERNSFILIWNFADLIHPQLVLQSPHECTTFSFNPDQPHLIAGGCVTGQIVLWDISKAQAQLRKKEDGKNGRASRGTRPASSTEGEVNPKDPATSDASGAATVSTDEADGDSGSDTLPPIEPVVVSLIDHSHKRPVSHLQWIPGDLQVNSLGKVKNSIKRNAESLSQQIVSCAGDGRIMFWDSRFNNLKRVKQPSPDEEGSESTSPVEEFHWVPLFKVGLTKHDGSVDYGLSKISLRGRIDLLLERAIRQQDDADMDSKNLPIPSFSPTTFSCTTEDGDMIFGDWLGVKNSKSARSSESSGDDSARVTDEKISWSCADHFRNAVALVRSPFFPFMLLSVAPNGFNVWKEDLERPLFSSPIVTGMSHMTCAAWSPTRPGVVIVGKSDGTVDIWDFIDQSHKPSASIPIAAYAITSIEFRGENQGNKRNQKQNRINKSLSGLDDRAIREILVNNATSQAALGDSLQLLALGDATGNLHILDIPRNLRWRMPKEEKIMLAFLEREVERVSDVQKRRRAREQEPGPASQGFSENSAAVAAHHTDAFVDISTLDRNSKEYKKLVEAEEKRYQALSAKLLAEELAH